MAVAPAIVGVFATRLRLRAGARYPGLIASAGHRTPERCRSGIDGELSHFEFRSAAGSKANSLAAISPCLAPVRILLACRVGLPIAVPARNRTPVQMMLSRCLPKDPVQPCSNLQRNRWAVSFVPGDYQARGRPPAPREAATFTGRRATRQTNSPIPGSTREASRMPVRAVLDACPGYAGADLIEDLFEREVDLRTPGHPSQTDLLTLAKLDHSCAAIAVEGRWRIRSGIPSRNGMTAVRESCAVWAPCAHPSSCMLVMWMGSATSFSIGQHPPSTKPSDTGPRKRSCRSIPSARSTRRSGTSRWLPRPWRYLSRP